VSVGVCRTYSLVAGGALLQLVLLAPVGSALAYVLDNDIYYRSSSYDGTEERRITFSGIPGIFYNGVPDWVYEGDFITLQQLLSSLPCILFRRSLVTFSARTPLILRLLTVLI
jgi:hypothetical protein